MKMEEELLTEWLKKAGNRIGSGNTWLIWHSYDDEWRVYTKVIGTFTGKIIYSGNSLKKALEMLEDEWN